MTIHLTQVEEQHPWDPQAMLVDCSPESIRTDACVGDHRQYVLVFWILESRIGFVGKSLNVMHV